MNVCVKEEIGVKNQLSAPRWISGTVHIHTDLPLLKTEQIKDLVFFILFAIARGDWIFNSFSAGLSTARFMGKEHEDYMIFG